MKRIVGLFVLYLWAVSALAMPAILGRKVVYILGAKGYIEAAPQIHGGGGQGGGTSATCTGCVLLAPSGAQTIAGSNSFNFGSGADLPAVNNTGTYGPAQAGFTTGVASAFGASTTFLTSTDLTKPTGVSIITQGDPATAGNTGLFGLGVIASADYSVNTSQVVTGAKFWVQDAGTKNSGGLIGADTYVEHDSSGTGGGLIGLNVEGNNNFGGVVTTNYGIRIQDQHSSGATTNAALLIVDQVTGTAIDVEGGPSVIKGTLGLGTSSQTAFSTAGAPTKINNLTTAGLGLPIQVGVARAVSQAAAIGTTTLFTVGAATAMFNVLADLDCDSTSAAATVNVTIGWTDPSNTAQTKSLASAVACTALGASSVGNLNFSFTAKNATVISYATSIVNTPTYDVRVALYQLTSN